VALLKNLSSPRRLSFEMCNVAQPTAKLLPPIGPRRVAVDSNLHAGRVIAVRKALTRPRRANPRMPLPRDNVITANRSERTTRGSVVDFNMVVLLPDPVILLGPSSIDGTARNCPNLPHAVLKIHLCYRNRVISDGLLIRVEPAGTGAVSPSYAGMSRADFS
jgi:hypothetical protein